MDGLYSALSAALEGIRNQSFRFLLGGLILLTVAFVTLAGAGPEADIPFYVLVGASVLLLLAGLYGRISPSGAPGPNRTRNPEMPNDRSELTRTLEEARRTLHFLEVKAAGIPASERTISLSRDLEQQRVLVGELETQLNDLPAEA
ncbi:hypothetical protein [Actinacidiphila epipremni]|uniref:DUF2339 domain-containing protein n=1 Tax=Actinacidiphila epipremni TaxID=2053013 RepID=A0ABX0ZTF2_9ACTN|nr:hypothetical protein [Actinacidiphila epipremni]NJP46042.1 hypothetical protein [Actinacidiphila epipremni]